MITPEQSFQPQILSVEQALQQLESSYSGLSEIEADKRVRIFGANRLERSKKPRYFRFAANFIHVMAIMLWVAGAIAFVAGMPQIAIAVWLVNIINGLFSIWQEYKAEKALEALIHLLPNFATVYRDGAERRVNAEALVPGDVIKLTHGDRVPADVRIIEQNALKVDESILTGESVPSAKTTNATTRDGTLGADNMLLAGTTVLTGTAKALVTAIGVNAVFGKIAVLTEGITHAKSPLEQEMSRTTRRISMLALAIGVAMFVGATVFAHTSLTDAFIFSLGMIVAFIPEGMVPTVTLSLALAVQRMAKQNALVKKLSAVETLGCTSVICTDKTGTLTENRMVVKHTWFPQSAEKTAEELLVRAACLCNDAELVGESNTAYSVIGDSMEAALLLLARQRGVDYKSARNDFPRTAEFPFDTDRKRMTTMHGLVAYVKGAPIELLRRCDLTPEQRQRAEDAVDQFARSGLRVLAFAHKVFESLPDDISIGSIEQHLTFIGLVALYDPPRAEVRDAVRKCHLAGIRVIMLTGDYPLTAEAIARHVDIIGVADYRITTGEQLEELSDDELKSLLSTDVVFARVSPQHKLRIVKAFQSLGNVVAVTGDGVNDSPALKQADIGIAMGMRGTDAARGAADIILLDDNFATIVKAIEQGRTVYSNIRKFVTYVFNSNMAEAVPFGMMLFSCGAIPLPLNIMQVLSIDLGTDIMPAIALGVESPEESAMTQHPRLRSAPLLDLNLLVKALLWYGSIESIAAASCYFFANGLNGWPVTALAAVGTIEYSRATTMTLAGIVASQVGAVFCCRSNKESLFKLGLFSNPAIWLGVGAELVLFALVVYSPLLQHVFATAALSLPELAFASLWMPVMILADEIRKGWLRRNQSKPVQ